MNRETALMQQIRAACNQMPDVRLFRNNTGFASKERVRYGLGTGSPDLVGVVCVNGIGRAIGMEVKTEKGRLTPEQKIWIDLGDRFGAPIACVRSVEDALAFIDEVRRGSR